MTEMSGVALPGRVLGVPAAPGVASGPVFLLDRRRSRIPKKRIADAEIEKEIQRLNHAIVQTEERLQHVKTRFSIGASSQGHAGIIEAYQLMLRDDHLLVPTVRRIREEHCNVEWALSKTIEEITQRFDEAGIDYIRERRSDVGFVGDQLLQALMGHEEVQREIVPPEGSILVVHEATPVDIVHWHGRLRAVVTATGGRTSHMVIVARSFSLPVVVGVGNWVDTVGQGDWIRVDGNRGLVESIPPDATASEVTPPVSASKPSPANRPPRSLPLDLLANIELPEEIPIALKQHAQGIGLYRTEYLFLDREQPPTEQEHFLYAADAIERMAPSGGLVTFRTLDFGSDKWPLFLDNATSGRVPLHEPNPALGLRSLRLCFQERELFQTQLRGLLRAAKEVGPCRILFPMVSGVSDWLMACDMLRICQRDLGLSNNDMRRVSIGVMIETPAAVMVADQLAQHVDFFSIGTNDLTQYALAVDRSNEWVEPWYQGLHPAILRMIHRTVQAAKEKQISVQLCGEMAANPLYAPLLLGLGIEGLSMNVAALPAVRAALENVDVVLARRCAEQALQLVDAESVEAFLKTHQMQASRT